MGVIKDIDGDRQTNAKFKPACKSDTFVPSAMGLQLARNKNTLSCIKVKSCDSDQNILLKKNEESKFNGGLGFKSAKDGAIDTNKLKGKNRSDEEDSNDESCHSSDQDTDDEDYNDHPKTLNGLNEKFSNLELSKNTHIKDDEKNELISRGPVRNDSYLRYSTGPYLSVENHRKIALQNGGGLLNVQNHLQGWNAVQFVPSNIVPYRFHCSPQESLQAPGIPVLTAEDVEECLSLTESDKPAVSDDLDAFLLSPGSTCSSLSHYSPSICSPRSVDPDNHVLNIPDYHTTDFTPSLPSLSSGSGSPRSISDGSTTPVYLPFDVQSDSPYNYVMPDSKRPEKTNILNISEGPVSSHTVVMPKQMTNFNVSTQPKFINISESVLANTRHCVGISPLGKAVYNKRESAMDQIKKKLKSPKIMEYIIEEEKVLIEVKGVATVMKRSLCELLQNKRKLVDERWLFRLHAHLKHIEKYPDLRNILVPRDGEPIMLLMACNNHADLPLAARLIVEEMILLNIKNDGKLNSLILELVSKGDSHIDLLSELFSVTTENNLSYFDLNCTNEKQQTPIHVAITSHSKQNPCTSTIKYLLDLGVKLLQDDAGMTPLHYSVIGDADFNIFNMLSRSNQLTIDRSIVDLQDCDGKTALHWACADALKYHSKLDIIYYLLFRNKANHKIKNHDNKMPKIPDCLLKAMKG